MKRGLGLIALVVAGVLVALLVGLYSENRNNPWMPAGRWLGWAVYTILLGVFVVRDHRRSWSLVSFWLTLAGLFAAHTMFYVLAFQAFVMWRGIWFMPISIAEYAILLLALHWLGYGEDGPTRNRRAPRRG